MVYLFYNLGPVIVWTGDWEKMKLVPSLVSKSCDKRWVFELYVRWIVWMCVNPDVFAAYHTVTTSVHHTGIIFPRTRKALQPTYALINFSVILSVVR
ncbi:MAG TPA: hypothetical protein DCX29_11170 [Hyphomonas sp.]|nr:hypothetical protein [Hyphomonas sp.]MAX84564.1 hypothetical protein [Hyphomonas sp.]HAW55446.1 hypothetical protein [Hyphomonas sp.]